MGQVFEQNRDLHRHWQRHFVQLHGGVLRRLTKAVALVPFGRRNSGHRRPWHSQLGAERSGRSNAAPESSNKRLHVTAAVRTERVSIEFVVTVYLHKRCPAEELAGGLDDCPSRPARMVVATRRTNCRLSPGSLTTPACTAAPILPEKSSCMQLSIQLIQLCAFGGKRTVNPCLL